MSAGGETAFRVSDVFYRYHQVLALNGLTMQVARGERVALLGSNGSGKSTLLRLLAGLAFPERGEISFLGEPVTERNLQEEAFFFNFRRRVGLVFQNPDVQLFNLERRNHVQASLTSSASRSPSPKMFKHSSSTAKKLPGTNSIQGAASISLTPSAISVPKLAPGS